ncbi:MAG TPA: nodulation protein NfeD, partial [Actinomycetota bacterium]|nr:nodulation protein NfeD [Actinomycetota bacterium]
AAPAQPVVTELRLSGVVDPFTASYVNGGIARANDEGDAAVLLTIDTPGGLDSSMRQIVQAIANSNVPVICYTSPSGARAASAGTFIMLSCPIAAMAPGTNIGAAHPVGVSGAIEQEKVTNDAAAYIRSLAQEWGRNADWAEKAVRDSVSISAEEAVRIHVVDLVRPSTTTLLSTICAGGPVSVGQRAPRSASGTTGLLRTPDALPNTCDATVVRDDMGLGAKLLHSLISPDFAFLFFFAGLVLIVIELLHPGVSIPGILGVLFLVAAFVSFGELPVQLIGVVLLVASAAFFLLELKHPGLGAPTLGGVVTLVLGGLYLFNPDVPNARVSPWLIGLVAAGLVLFFGIVVKAVVDARHLPPVTGGLAGENGVAVTDLAPDGQVRARRETWTARSAGLAIAAGTPVRVVAVEGLRLIVEPLEEPAETPAPAPEEAAGLSKGGGS